VLTGVAAAVVMLAFSRMPLVMATYHDRMRATPDRSGARLVTSRADGFPQGMSEGRSGGMLMLVQCQVECRHTDALVDGNGERWDFVERSTNVEG
jgi:hypothetical protein